MENCKRIYGQQLLTDDQIEVYILILYIVYIQYTFKIINKIYLRYLKKLFQHLLMYLYIYR